MVTSVWAGGEVCGLWTALQTAQHWAGDQVGSSGAVQAIPSTGASRHQDSELTTANNTAGEQHTTYSHNQSGW